ncbi:MAG: hypothetical protein IPK64_08375 [bacterium]|nr:hypothetical protein [bacterium]
MATTPLTATRTCRVLYYGPASAGKRANLRVIHRSIPPEQRLAVATDDPERQIAFRVRHGAQGEWQVLVQAVDAGRERPRAAGRDMHAPCDGIVFVVDSGASMLDQSLSALESLKTWLESWDLDLMRIPIVIQYNRRDRPDTLPVDRLESLLNPWGLLSFPANAANGDGARETLKAILGLAVNHLVANPAAAALARAAAAPPPSPSPAPEPPRSAPGPLGIDYGPPVPGAEFGETTRALSEAIYHELRPTVVVPVRIPRRLLSGREPVRLLLEVQVDDDTPY